jgi:hypothetical protein
MPRISPLTFQRPCRNDTCTSEATTRTLGGAPLCAHRRRRSVTSYAGMETNPGNPGDTQAAPAASNPFLHGRADERPYGARLAGQDPIHLRIPCPRSSGKGVLAANWGPRDSRPRLRPFAEAAQRKGGSVYPKLFPGSRGDRYSVGQVHAVRLALREKWRSTAPAQCLVTATITGRLDWIDTPAAWSRVVSLLGARPLREL